MLNPGNGLKFFNSKKFLLLFLLLILVLAIRLFHFSFFEFKFDQLNSILIGNQTKEAHFLVTHGPATGIGINMPPFFPYFMGLLVIFSQNPFWITFFYAFLNILALILVGYYFYIQLPRNYAYISILLIALSPAFTIYSNIIWPQCLLPPLVTFFFICLTNFISRPQGKYFVFLCFITSIIAQFHLSGFFLFPALTIIAFIYRKEIGIKFFILGLILAGVMFMPYMYHLLFEREGDKFVSYANLGSRHIYWKIFLQHIRLTSFDFLRYYFRHDFNQVLNNAVGKSWVIFYPLSCMLITFFVFGVIWYVSWIIKARRFFDQRKEAILKYPLVFQISGFIFLTVTISYLVLKIETPPHYLIVLFPVYAVLTGFPVYRLWERKVVRYIFIASLASTLVLFTSVLVFLSKAGGHPHEYGFSYRSIINLREKIREVIPPDSSPEFSISFIGEGKADKEPIYYLLSKLTRQGGQVLPVNIAIGWDKVAMRYEYHVKVVNK